MTYFMIDSEADGPIPGFYSMVELGAVIVEPELVRTFYGQLRPIGPFYDEDALAVCGLTREETLAFEDPTIVMQRFGQWVRKNTKGRPIFIADNNGFDWAFVNWYFHALLPGTARTRNPFGHSSRNLNDLYKGFANDMSVNVRDLKRDMNLTKHTHNPVDDARGNAEALLELIYKGLKIDL